MKPIKVTSFAVLFLLFSVNAFALIDTNNIADGAVTTPKIADGAVTDAKISGIISSSKIEKYGKIAIVAQTGGDYTDPVAAMNDIATWCGNPSSTNPCLLQIKPGVYNINGISLVMQQYVDIEGSGEKTTKLAGCNGDAGLVQGASNSELRYLTVDANCSGYLNRAVYNDGTTSYKMRNVTVKMTSSGDACEGIRNIGGAFPEITNSSVEVTCSLAVNAIVNSYGSGGIIENVSITATAGNGNAKGVYIDTNSTGTLKNVSVTVTGSANYSCAVMSDFASTLKIDHSSLSGGYASLCGGYYGGTSYIYTANTKIEGATTLYGTGAGELTVKCINVYDGDYNALTCP